MSSSSPERPRSLKRLSQKRTVAPHSPILAAIPGALSPSTACWMICARRTSPAPSFCERVIRASLCPSSSLNARTRRVIATSPARTGVPCNAPDSEKSHPTCRMNHLDTAKDPLFDHIGPRVHDMELRHIVDIMLRVNAGAYSFEAANPRHEHEWKVWQEVTLPEGK